ncbi:membrane protein [Acidovorax phage ACP17]|uniref:Uncharacterized protein n=1 Tax=Acidovorax phage ACP17 TaxID=2010329 RepID=A0A218M2X4_9CAUD|nr:membrane protein [Acidovorax phage ACP17]ASD50395.1 hypothetical protein [Acidovorax phage ACP17]
MGTLFSAAFMVIMLIILWRGMRGADLSGLFTSQDEAGGISLTKFWQNVAYGAATVAFLSINIAGKATGASLEIVWVIYLGVVASNAVLSKWISMKYTRTEEQPQKPSGPYSNYPRDMGYGMGPEEHGRRLPPKVSPKMPPVDNPD